MPPANSADRPRYKELASRSFTLFQAAGQMEWVLPLEKGTNAERIHLHGEASGEIPRR